ncbi:MAG: XdhC family protein [Gemmataceae bacterium]|nr:XdhC family protein [Gemmataceae bacterium]MCS7269455.1 XdhC family protein [Gemmataceae bacterium]MDW8241638.1 XdhC family protein [Thermogemmata sp.]
MDTVLDELVAARDQNLECVYCQVVETRGSTPQKAGAAMLVYADGRQSGTLGGGCIEADVRRRALARLHDQAAPLLCTFTLDGDYGWDDGLICGGRMTILIHPLTARSDADQTALTYYRRLRDQFQTGMGHCEVIALEDTPWWSRTSRWLFADSQLLAAWGSPTVTTTEVVQQVLSRRPWSHPGDEPLAARPTCRQGLAWLPTPRRKVVLIVGAGHVGQAVAQLATAVDFDVWVLDDRARYASAERFPQARRRLVAPIGTALQQLAPSLNPDVYAVIVTRGHNHDEEALFHLAPSPCGYLGMIGSRRKIRLIFEDLQHRGLSPTLLQRVRAPIGLPIGSQSVMEIAISIVAELIAWRNLGPESFLRGFPQAISADDGQGLSADGPPAINAENKAGGNSLFPSPTTSCAGASSSSSLERPDTPAVQEFA